MSKCPICRLDPEKVACYNCPAIKDVAEALREQAERGGSSPYTYREVFAVFDRLRLQVEHLSDKVEGASHVRDDIERELDKANRELIATPSLRDQFAMRALPQLLNSPNGMDPHHLALAAYGFADAMLEVRAPRAAISKATE